MTYRLAGAILLLSGDWSSSKTEFTVVESDAGTCPIAVGLGGLDFNSNPTKK